MVGKSIQDLAQRRIDITISMVQLSPFTMIHKLLRIYFPIYNLQEKTKEEMIQKVEQMKKAIIHQNGGSMVGSRDKDQ